MHEHERNEGSGEQSGPLFEKQAELLVIGMIAGGKGKRLPNPSTIRRYGVLYRTIGYGVLYVDWTEIERLLQEPTGRCDDHDGSVLFS